MDDHELVRHLEAVRTGRAATRPVRTATVVGSGLVGTSVALALVARGIEVRIDDREPAVAERAVAMGAGTLRSAGGGASDLVVIAVPPDVTGEVLAAEQRARTGRVYTDVASVKRSVIESARRCGAVMSSYVPGHPMAGGHTSGPEAHVPTCSATARGSSPRRRRAIRRRWRS